MPLKVAIFSGTFRERADGVARSLQRLSMSLSERGIEQWVFAPMVDQITQPHLHIEKVFSLPVPGYRDYRISLPASKLTQTLDKISPDIIHIATPDLLGWFAAKYAWKRGLPVISTYHTHFPSYLNYYHLHWLEPWMWRRLISLYNRCEIVFAPSQAMIELLTTKGVKQVTPSGGPRLRLWSRGVDRQLFNPDRRSSELRKSWGGEENFYVAFVGRLVWYKEVATVREVYRKLEQQADSAIRFIFVGDGPAANELKATMPKAIFVGHVDKDLVGKYLASCDILLFPSTTETFGQVVLEAMGSGIPTLVSDVGGPAEQVHQSQAGLVVRAGDIDGFATALQRCMLDQTLHRRLSERALAYAHDHDWEVVNRAVLNAYQEISTQASVNHAHRALDTARSLP